MFIKKIKEFTKESPDAAIGLVFWTVIISFVLCLLIFGKPGPDKGTPVCVYDDLTIHFLMSVDYAGGNYTAKIKRTAKVGDRGSPFEKLESLTPMPDGTYNAKYRNIVTGKTATNNILKCSDVE